MDKKDQKDKRFTSRRFNLERANNGHVILLVLVGAYVIYMIYMMIHNYQIGETSMKLYTMVIVTVIMFAIVGVCFGYASYIFYIVRNKERIGREQDLEKGYIDEYGNPLDEDGNPVDEPVPLPGEAEESEGAEDPEEEEGPEEAEEPEESEEPEEAEESEEAEEPEEAEERDLT